jgi:hypothetical protein
VPTAATAVMSYRVSLLGLYRRVLRLHARLPLEMRALGDDYVRQEFRTMQKVTKEGQVTAYASCPPTTTTFATSSACLHPLGPSPSSSHTHSLLSLSGENVYSLNSRSRQVPVRVARLLRDARVAAGCARACTGRGAAAAEC